MATHAAPSTLQRPIRVILADPHQIVREGIAAFCAQRSDISIVGQCSTGAEARRMILNLRPDFAVVELQIGEMAALTLLRELKASGSHTKVLVLAISRNERAIHDLFAAGAAGYLLKDGPARHLFDAIAYALEGGQYLTPLIQRSALDEAPGDGAKTRSELLRSLSQREHQVFTWLVEGKRPRDIAAMLNISPKTVDTYRSSLMRKLNLQGVASLVKFAMENDLTA